MHSVKLNIMGIWVAISNLCDSTFCSIKNLNAKLLMKMKSPFIALICFVQIGQVVPQLCINNFTYVNLQWLTNVE